MRHQLSTLSVRLLMGVLCVLMLANLSPNLAHAAPDEVGRYPNPTGTCQNIVDYADIAGLGITAGGVVAAFSTGVPNPIGATIAGAGVTLQAISKLAGGLCEYLDDGVRANFVRAYEEAQSHGVWPGDNSNEVHYWVGGIMIQDFSGTRDSSGKVIGDGWGAIISSGADGSDAYYVYGSTWVAYKRAVYEKSVLGGGIFPGYPTSLPHQWNHVTIQDFSGSSWGISAIIGGDQEYAWLVAGNHLQAYIDADGSNTLRNPLGPVELNADGWYEQKFEVGRILELAGKTKVQFYESSDTPPELPAVGREDAAPPPANNSSTTCSDTGIPQITNGLTYSPANPDTTTSVQFSFTITNIGCGTFQPEVLAIGGRNPYSEVSDPFQIRDFALGSGESREISQTTVLSIPGTHEFFMVFLRVNGGWNEIPDTSGVSQHIYINVTDAMDGGANSSSDIVAASPDSTEEAPTSSQGNDLAPMDIGATGPNGHEIGAQFTVTTQSGEPIGSCTLEGDAAAPYPLSCRVPVPRYTTVVVTLDVNTISPGYAPIENPMLFDTSSEPGAASHWGVLFQLEPKASTNIDGQTPDIAVDTSSNSEAVDIALITRDPANGELLTGTCYVLVGFSLEGCDENGDGQVTFADIPFGIYTVRQTRTPAGYSTINDYDINVQPTGYMEGPSFGVPLGFVVKQAPEQNAPNTRNVSIVFIDMRTHERVITGTCVELIGASIVGCDEDLIDGQVDFLNVPAGGPYELSFSNLPAGFEVGMVGGPLSVTINAGPSDPANVMVFVLLAGSDGAGSAPIQSADSTSSNGAQIPASTSGGTEATILMTFRGCPEGFNPNTGDFYSECTIPLDAPDASIISWGGDGQGGMSITSLERQYDGAYIYNAGPDTITLQLSGLAPILRDAYQVIGADGVNGDNYAVKLVNGETREVFIYYYYE